MGVLALILGIILVTLEAKWKPKYEGILKHLPGYNCGACGYAGCEALAKAIQENPEEYTKCRGLKGDKKEEMLMYLKEQYGLESKESE